MPTEHTERERMIQELVKYHWAFDENEFNGDKIADFILADRRRVLEEIDNCVTEEINLSNYDHETICRISRMWDNASETITRLKGKNKEGK